jgi:hypothetical protein
VLLRARHGVRGPGGRSGAPETASLPAHPKHRSLQARIVREADEVPASGVAFLVPVVGGIVVRVALDVNRAQKLKPAPKPPLARRATRSAHPVLATLDSGDVPRARRRRPGARTPRATAAPEGQEAAARRDGAEPVWSWDTNRAPGPGLERRDGTDNALHPTHRVTSSIYSPPQDPEWMKRSEPLVAGEAWRLRRPGGPWRIGRGSSLADLQGSPGTSHIEIRPWCWLHPVLSSHVRGRHTTSGS